MRNAMPKVCKGFYKHICHVVLTPIVYNLGLEIITILVSSKIGSIND